MFKLIVAVALACFFIITSCATQGNIAGGASGTAAASAQGFYGPITVTITVENGRLTSVVAEGQYETPGIGTRPLTRIPAQMVQRNSFDVDTVSGATITSRAVIQAAKEAEALIR